MTAAAVVVRQRAPAESECGRAQWVSDKDRPSCAACTAEEQSAGTSRVHLAAGGRMEAMLQGFQTRRLRPSNNGRADGSDDAPNGARFTSSCGWLDATYACTPTWAGVATSIVLVVPTPDALYSFPAAFATFCTLAVLTMSSARSAIAAAMVDPADAPVCTRN